MIYVFISLIEPPDEVTDQVNLGNPDEFYMLGLAKNLLDWEPRFSLDEVLPLTIAYFDQLLGQRR